MGWKYERGNEMSFLAYIAGTLIAPNFAGYLLSKGLTNREEKN